MVKRFCCAILIFGSDIAGLVGQHPAPGLSVTASSLAALPTP